MTENETLALSPGVLAATVSVGLAACGGGSGDQPSSDDGNASPDPGNDRNRTREEMDRDIIRFLHQSTFGPTPELLEEVRKVGIAPWLERQMDQECEIGLLQMVARNQGGVAPGALVKSAGGGVVNIFYDQAVNETAQVRCRVGFALSQIIVYSFKDELGNAAAAPAFNDILQQNAFGNYKDILYKVSRSTAMGVFLTFLGGGNVRDPNFKPDENYARELMQLFSIGVHQLNPDGSVKLDARGEPIPTYGSDDIFGLSKIFTGNRLGYNSISREWDVTGETIVRQDGHVEGPKTFLGKTVHKPGDMLAELRDAIQIIFDHPNVGPFVAGRLIKLLVTSNPSPGYVQRVGMAFNDNGKGVRGDMRAVVRAIFLDPEARDLNKQKDPSFGKHREPVLMLSTFLRISNSGKSDGESFWKYPYTGDALWGINQLPWAADSVFNFFDHEFVRPGSEVDKRDMIAPESALFQSVSSIGMLNFIAARIRNQGLRSSNIIARYTRLLELVDDSAKLLDHLDLFLTANTLSDSGKAKAVRAVDMVPKPTKQDEGALSEYKRKRIAVALMLVMFSPAFIIQR